MYRFFYLLLTVAIFAAPAQAQWMDQNGKPLADTPSQKSVGAFGGMLVITPDPEGARAAWAKPPAPNYGPQLRTTKTAVRGDVVVGMVVFLGCAADKNGNCQLRGDVKIQNPDGSVYGEFNDVEFWIYPPPMGQNLQLAMPDIGVQFEPTDPFGAYAFNVTLRDTVAGAKMTLAEKVELLEKKPAP